MVGLKQPVWIAPAAMIAGSVVLSSAAQAEEGFRFYGHIGGAITSVDDGVETNSDFGDNSSSPSRIGAWYETGVAGGTLKFNFETSLGLRGTDALTQNGNVDFLDWDKTNLRKVEAIYETARFGTFSVGQGSMASDGVASQGDLSGTGLSGSVAIGDTAGGYFFREADGTLSGVAIGDIFSDLDGGRRGRVRYDTPTFGGFTFSAAAGTEILRDGVDTEYYDLAVRYGETFGDFQVAGAVSYGQTANSSNDADTILASFGTLHTPTGISANINYGTRDRDTGVDSDYVYVKLGLQRDWFSIGRTYLSVDAYRGNDFAEAGDESTAFGIEAVQDIDNSNMEVFASYHQHGYDVTTGRTFQDVDAFLVGARWAF